MPLQLKYLGNKGGDLMGASDPTSGSPEFTNLLCLVL